MDELESQIAKIQLGNSKTSSSYVYVMAEKAAGSMAELYVVAEMPLFSPAAEESCERICFAVASSLKRAYKKTAGESTFENAIAQINEELGKLASLGQAQWIDKLSCTLGVKDGESFHIATCGKVAAYLLRNREYTDISCSSKQTHPLKTFENYATGKIRLGDVLILSTTQLFNYVSMDRLLNIVSNADFLTATKTVIQLLKDNEDPQISFAVLLNLQVPLGKTKDEEQDLENYIAEKPAASVGLLGKAWDYAKTAFALDRKSKRIPTVNLPKISFGQRLKNFGNIAKNLVTNSRGLWQTAKTSAKTVQTTVNPQNFKQFSGQKKFFLISAFILLIALMGNISIALHLKKTSAVKNQISGQLTEAQNLLSGAQGSLLYKDDAKAAKFLKQAKEKLPDSKKIAGADKNLYNKILGEINDTQTQLEKIFRGPVENLGSLGSANNLIKLPYYLAAQINGALVSYNKQNGKIEDGALNLPAQALSSTFVSETAAAVYDGNNLYLWDFSTGKLGAGFSAGGGSASGGNLPAKDNFAGLAYYPDKSRVYIVDKKLGQIVSFAPVKNSFARPVIVVKDPSLNLGLDIAIDGSIYVLNQSGINKFQSGKLADFNISLITPFSGSGKIYTQKDFKYLYLLDAGNNSILIFDKKGSLANTLKSDQFTKLKDFEVDEKNKIMYVLNDSSLLKVVLP